MTTVSATGSASYSLYTGSTTGQARHRPSAEAMAEKLFSTLDSSGKGYIDASDLSAAISGLSASSSTQNDSISAEDIIGQFDGDGDGKVSESEFAAGFKQLAEALDSQFDQTRVGGGMPPPPPPAGDDAGFTKEELSAQLEEIGDSDSRRSSLISSVVQNFDEADTDGDGKVSFAEAMAFDQTTTGSSTSSSESTSGTATSGTAASGQLLDAQIFRQIMELMRAYGNETARASGLSVTA